MPASPAVRVGILVFIALVAFTAVAVFLTGWRLNVSGYPIVVIFDDALGVTKGSEVRMAGVTIGNVKDITLDRNQRAVMTLQVNRKFRIPVGSEFVLRVGMLIGDKYVEIVPNRATNKYYEECTIHRCPRIEGVVPPSVDDLIPKADRVLTNLEKTTESINRALGDQKFQERVDRSLANVERATGRLDQTMAIIQRTVVVQQDEVGVVVGNVRIASESLRDLTGELARFTKEGAIQRDISATLAAARSATESLERSTSSLEGLVTAPDLQEDFRATIREARETVEQARRIIDRVGSIVGVDRDDLGKKTEPVTGAKIQIRRPSIEALLGDGGSNRANAYVTIPTRANKFVRLGAYDIGDGNKGILQLGQSLDNKTDLRYGLYASKLSVGVDHVLSPRIYGTANLYDPDRVRLDLQSEYKLNEDWGVLFGVDRVFRDNQLTLGARYTR